MGSKYSIASGGSNSRVIFNQKARVLEAILFNNQDYAFASNDLKAQMEAVKINQNSWSYLHLAVWLQKDNIVRALIKLGADVCLKDDHGETPLHLAAIQGSINIYQELLDAGSVDSIRNIVFSNQEGKSPYDMLLDKGITTGPRLTAKNLAIQTYGDPSFRTDTEDGLVTKSFANTSTLY